MEESVNEDRNEAAQEFMEEIVDDLGYTPKGGKNQGSGPNIDQSPVPKYLIPGGIGIVLLIAAIVFFLMGRNGDHTEELASMQTALNRLEERMAGLNRLEERMARLEGLKGFRGLEDRIVHLEKEGKRLQQETQRIHREGTASSRKPTPSVKERHHTVRSGESLYTIARKYGISADKLCQINNITRKKPIQPGQKLLVEE
jgi:hypothetical protein